MSLIKLSALNNAAGQGNVWQQDREFDKSQLMRTKMITSIMIHQKQHLLHDLRLKLSKTTGKGNKNTQLPQ